MAFLFRSIKEKDIHQVLSLARQFSLLNLPNDKKTISEKIKKSEASFAGELPREEGHFVFVVEDTEQELVAGSSQILAKHGTPDEPTYSFQVIKKERFSQELGVGFIHQILRLKVNVDGPTEIGGLVVDRTYRSRPEKVGRLASLGRFLYMAERPHQFEKVVYAQMAPPLTEEGRSEFWEALGRRFTGLPYQEADLLSQKNKEFIRSLFPEEDIYLCLLDSKARLVMGRVGPETAPALHLLETIGFQYMYEVDPFDGGPHFACERDRISLVKNAQKLKFNSSRLPSSYDEMGLVGLTREGEFRALSTACFIDGDQIELPEKSQKLLEADVGEVICFTSTKMPTNRLTKKG